MARRAQLSSPAEAEKDVEENSDSGPTRRRPGRVSHLASHSPSPAASFSSDKENREGTGNLSRRGNGKAKTMQPPKLPTPAYGETATPRANKRQKLGERDAPNASRAVHEKQLETVGDKAFYDPEQSMEERRGIRKEIRDLSRELNGA